MDGVSFLPRAELAGLAELLVAFEKDSPAVERGREAARKALEEVRSERENSAGDPGSGDRTGSTVVEDALTA